MFYAVVLHDFVAERADELDAKAGDPISVVAQSNREWFVAKPIGRLGRPGLIPVTFVEVRDPASNTPIKDLDALMDRGDLPRVEDWKRAMFNYKQNSITLGVLDEPSNRNGGVPNSPFMPNSGLKSPGPNKNYPPPQQPNPPSRTPSPQQLPKGLLLTANVVSFHYEMEEYWFRIDATFQPFDPKRPQSIPGAKQLVLFRVYNDFYDFQVNLLDTFPREAGRQPPSERILPYMPGPAQRVDDETTATRRIELDEYLKNLCELNRSGARYILEHDVVRNFLALKPGDVETDIDPQVNEIESLYGYNNYGHSNNNNEGFSQNDDLLGDDDEYASEVRDTLGNMKINAQDEGSEGSDYEDESNHQRRPYSQMSRQPSVDSQSNLSLRQQALAQNHQRTGSQPLHLPDSRARSPGPLRSYSPSAISPMEERGSSGRWPDSSATSSPISSHSKTPSMAPSTRSRSNSHAASNLNNPPISAANSQTAFIKIKIFDRVTDDLIAIRVHPRVSHGELMDKVQARLGGEVIHLRYRDSLSKELIGLDNDDALSGWIEGTDKHVLYAD